LIGFPNFSDLIHDGECVPMFVHCDYISK